MTSILLAVLLVGLTAAADGAQPPSDYKHLKPLEWMIGDWVGEFSAPFDLGPVRKGDRGLSFVSRRWAVDRSCMLLDTHQVVGGRRVAISHEVAAWDAAANRVGNWAFGALGTGGGAFTEVGDKAVLTWTVNGKDGKLQGTSILEKIDADSYTWRAEQITLDGRKLPDWPMVTYRRKTGAPADDLWNAWRDLAVGQWIGTGTISRDAPNLGLAKGDQFTYLWTWKSDPSGAVLLGEGEFRLVGKDLKSAVRAVCHWDPETRQVRQVVCWSNGQVEEILFQRRQGTGFVGTYVAKTPGSTTERAAIVLACPDNESAVYRYLDGPRKGEVSSSWKRQKSP
jgi:hypothetical protein